MVKTVDTKKYCMHLTNPPAVRGDYQDSKEFYICKFTERPCVAKKITDRTSDGDIFAYSYPVIDNEMLERCPALNLSDKIARALQEDAVKRQISELEQKLPTKK